MGEPGELLDRIRGLEDIEQIKVLKHRYIRTMTFSLWDELENLLTEDVHAAYTDGKYVFDGRVELMAFLRGAHDAALTDVLGYWHVTMPEISLLDASSATGIWGMYHFFMNKADNTQLEQFAYYEDEYAKVDGCWRIRKTGYRRVMEQEFDRKQLASLRLIAG